MSIICFKKSFDILAVANEDKKIIIISLVVELTTLYSTDPQSWADANVFAFLSLRASDAKAFCRRDGRRLDSDEKDTNTKDAMFQERKISHIFSKTTTTTTTL